MRRTLVGTGIVAASLLGALTVSGMAAAPAGASSPFPVGTVLIADQNCSCIWEQQPAGEATYLAGNDEADEDVTMDASGELFWTQALNGDVQELTRTDGIQTLTTASSPFGIAVDQQGNVYFGAGGSVLYKLVPGGTPTPVLNTVGVITSMVADGNGDLYAIASNELIVIPVGSTTATTVDVPGNADLTSVRLDADNNVYLSNGGGDDALELPAGTVTADVLGNVGGFTQGLAVDDSGNVYVGEPSGEAGDGAVWKITDGTATQYSDGPIAGTSGLAVYPTPQPAVRSVTTTSLTTTSPTFDPSESPVQLQASTSSDSGVVQFEQNDTALGAPVAVNGSGVANLTTTLAAGTDNVTALFFGTGSAAPSISSPLAFTVGQLDSTTTITAPNGTKVPGDDQATVDVAVHGTGPTPTGSVDVYAGTKVLANDVALDGAGEATAQFALPFGTSDVHAVYSGDTDYVTSTSANIAFKSTKPYVPSVTGKAKYSTSGAGEKVKLSVAALGNSATGAPTGTISADDGFTCGRPTVSSDELKATCNETFTTVSEDENVQVSFTSTSPKKYVSISQIVNVRFGP
jgi:hypothetical protein